MRSSIALLLSLFFSASIFAQTETYTIDPSHSFVRWHISHFGFSEQSGKWFAKGTIEADAEKPENSKVEVTIPLADVVTGIPKLDEHLKTDEFFDVANYPVASFVSNKIVMQGKDKAKIYGTLTLHGVSKPIVLEMRLRKHGMNPVTNKETAGFTAVATIKRSDFGIKSYLPGLGDEVPLVIEVEATKAKKIKQPT